MTNTSPITTTNFIAGTIGVGMALLIMPQIIMGTVGAQEKGAARSSTNSLVEDIGNVCGNEDSAEGSINIQQGYELTLNYDDYTLRDVQSDEVIEERKMACKIDSQTTIDSSWSRYSIESEQNDDDEDLYDLSEAS